MNAGMGQGGIDAGEARGRVRPTADESAPPDGAPGTAAARGRRDEAGIDASSPVTAAAAPPTVGLAVLLEQARLAQGQLGTQPLPITNHHHRLIAKLFGG